MNHKKIYDECEKLTLEKNKINTELRVIEEKINEIKNMKRTLREEKVKLLGLDAMKDLYGKYLKFISRNGLPVLMIKSKIALLEKLIGEFLKDFVDFIVRIDLVDGVGLDIWVEKKENRLNVHDLSGFESFIVNIAFKLVLFKSNYVNKCSMLCIDEGLDCIDAANFKKLRLIIEKIKNVYGKVILISHIEGVRELSDFRINIERFGKNGKYSRIATEA